MPGRHWNVFDMEVLAGVWLGSIGRYWVEVGWDSRSHWNVIGWEALERV